ncbi:MAG TPA: DUF1080 domain-containing protein [Planctomycetaceae bacterium]|jgi:hypothetical protein|nr:DUF1080 domain-containing protein [Planctomycetaceae bacterium]HCP85613.1 DUF1080 domain-containing protein [Planctomycetaceae bacterium]|tara:strand:+ start:5963 stop:7222 length:1260 start_codon:yes stop_codon:yes gene_type:complete
MSADAAELNVPPKGFKALFNGKNLSGWYGWSTKNPEDLWSMSADDQAAYKKKSLEDVNQHWSVQDGILVNDGHGLYLTSEEEFSNFELLIDYKTVPKADSGIYLKAVPQVQIWDFTEEAKFGIGADKGSGGLWNNSKGAKGKDPLVRADKPFGEWNSFRIRQIGSRTWVWMNGKLLVDNAIMENYFDRSRPLFPQGPIQLQTHGGEISWRNVFVREISPNEATDILSESADDKGFVSIFNGKDLSGWQGATASYDVVDGAIQCRKGTGGNLFTEKEYSDFVVRLEIKTPPAGNNGLAIRYPGKGNPAFDGMTELQVLDVEYPGKLAPYQFHGSAYSMVPAHRGYLYPAGHWNYQEVTVVGSKIKVELNGSVILDCDLADVTDEAKIKQHPGKDLKSGFFGFAGHNDPVQFRNITIKELK